MNKICHTEPVKLNESISLNQYEDLYSKEYITKIVQNNSCRSEQKVHLQQQKAFDQLCKETKLKILATDKLDLQQQITTKIQYMKTKIHEQHKKNLNSKVYSILYGTLSSQEGSKTTALSSKKDFKPNDQRNINDQRLSNPTQKQVSQNQPPPQQDSIIITKKKPSEQVQLPVIQSRSQVLIQKLLEKQNRQKRSVSHNVNGYNQNSDISSNNSNKYPHLQQQILQQQSQLLPSSQKQINSLIDKSNTIVFNDRRHQGLGDISNSMYLEGQQSIQNLQDYNISQVEQNNRYVELFQNQKEEYYLDQNPYPRNYSNRKSQHKKAQYNSQMNPHKNSQRSSQVIGKLKSFTQAVDSFPLVKQVSRSLHKTQENLDEERLINITNNNPNGELNGNKIQSTNNANIIDKKTKEIQGQSPTQSQIIQFEFPQGQIREKSLNSTDNRSGSTPLKSNTNVKRINVQQNNVVPAENEGKRNSTKNEKGRVISPFCLYPVLINEQNGGAPNPEEINSNKNSQVSGLRNMNRIQIHKSSEQIAFKDAQSPKQRGTPINKKGKISTNEECRSPYDKSGVSPSYVVLSSQNLKLDQSPLNISNIKLDKQMSQSSIESSEIYNFDGIKTKQSPQKYDLKVIQQHGYKKYFSSNTERSKPRSQQTKAKDKVENLVKQQMNNNNIDQQIYENAIKDANSPQKYQIKKPSGQVVVYSSIKKSTSSQRLPRQQSDFKHQEENNIKKIKLLIKDYPSNIKNDQAQITSKITNNEQQVKLKSDNVLQSPAKQQSTSQILSTNILDDQLNQQQQQQKYNIRSIPLIANIKNTNNEKVQLKNDILSKLINSQSPQNEKNTQNNSNNFNNSNNASKNIEFDLSKKPSIASQLKEEQSYNLEKYFKNKYSHQYKSVTPEKKFEKKRVNKNLKRNKNQENDHDFTNLDPWEIELCQDNYIFTYHKQNSHHCEGSND